MWAKVRRAEALEEGTMGGVAIVKKHGEPWIRVSPRGKQGECLINGPVSHSVVTECAVIRGGCGAGAG
ncbi:hypothetical protein SAMN06272781_0200 [Streptomyces sp. 1222.2]|uniref:Uncharacterized protein n=1 Tax=Streptomyces stelliscabiei TaxID=146820 RepID=A0A8I0PB33_9ACTN|nr:hypothetical protein [Streptomyces stelliscabiei]SOD65526.1 hypothetical protein SAMN06272781_0200 [Streptomyces sp. 1222.2]